MSSTTNGVAVSASAPQLVDWGSLPKSSHTKKLLKMLFTASLLGAQQNRDSVENKPASLLVASLSKTLNGVPPSSKGRQIVGPCSSPVVVAPVQLETCKPSVSANAVWPIYTSSCIKLTTNSSNDEEERRNRLQY